MKKNKYSMTKKSKEQYNWWWHSFVATDSETGQLKPFFIEYYVINPALWKGQISFGQSKENKAKGIKPSYAMMKVGTWGDDKAQLHSFHNIVDFDTSDKGKLCRIGANELSETALSGSVCIDEHDSRAYPEMMTDAGSMSWQLSVKKDLAFDAGYGSSSLFEKLGAFHMYWHAQGMKCQYSGEVIYNNKTYHVYPETSFGYQDRNWGKAYTNPWIWLNCNSFYSNKSGEKSDASLLVGGGCPVVFGKTLPRKILMALYYEGKLIEFNFSKFWKRSRQCFNTAEDDLYFYWDVVGEDRKLKIEARFKCEKSKMILVNYESPDGEKKHERLWNGGHAEGTVRIFKKKCGKYTLLDELSGYLGGCEYGEY